MPRGQQESKEQSAVVRWFKMQYPKYQECIIAIPNGVHLAGKTDKDKARQMAKLKREGLKPGASDLFIAVPVGDYSGLWLEMKKTGENYSKVSTDQRKHLALMKQVGYAADWAAGIDQAVNIIKKYMDGKS